ncbi:PREDICTED: leucine-rich repeat-containing protein 25 [Chrysochloris asiatica]|uniref:Leucine-rich repeat-containing protein 25 n=1 Tax=Chrysochloris asiatica TaxID=185453 RepID=A0A9B0U3L9_CHRAS|nr:PREDICTED: leucine-rich repeat-containing protein 25 [Chrysochloris asiatica]
MEEALVWTLLSLLLPHDAGTQEYSCPEPLKNVNWTMEFPDKCLNFSNQDLVLPQNQSLQASNVVLLDLSANNLRELPPLFFKNLNTLKILSVMGNPLDHIDGTLAQRCDLELKADCGCGLAAWHEVWRDNCSDQLPLKCLDMTMGTWRNLSAFLEGSCAPGLALSTIGALAAGGCLLLGIVIAGPILAWRLCKRQAANSHSLGKSQASKEDPRPNSVRQPRYSSRAFHPKSPVVALPNPHTPHYENMFLGQPAAGSSFQEFHCDRQGGHSPDNDFYMNYEGVSQPSQPIYGNLTSLGEASLDEEDYVVPGC